MLTEIYEGIAKKLICPVRMSLTTVETSPEMSPEKRKSLES
jgi:hypothetical protein